MSNGRLTPAARLLAHDRVWSQRLAAQAGRPGRYRAAWLLARTGDSLFWSAVIALLLWQRRPLARPLLHSVAASAAFVYTAKSIFRRGRPHGPGRAWSADRFAFPSGHAARAAAVALTLTHGRPTLTPLALLWATAVAVARVILGRHYVTDVAGGLASGLLVGALLTRARRPQAAGRAAP